MKIVFAIKALGNQGGGAERVLAAVVSGLAERGHEITIVSNDSPGTAAYYPLDDAVGRVDLGIGNVLGKSGLSDVVRRILALRRAVAKLRPDVVVAFMHSTYIPVGIALIGTGLPIVASEHISPEHYRSRPLERLLLQCTPLIATRITVVSEQIQHSFNWWLRRKMTAVPNPVSFSKREKHRNLSSATIDKKTLLSVGRLAEQKNQRCLIAAFSTIACIFPDWKLRIVGEGELRGELEAQVRDLGLSDSVELPGAVREISDEYFAADLFVLPSTYESFGLATAEALLHGLPAVGFADCPGTNSLIRHNENGILVDGPDRTAALAAALETLMADPCQVKRFSSAKTDWLENMFGIDSVVDTWERLIRDVSEAR